MTDSQEAEAAMQGDQVEEPVVSSDENSTDDEGAAKSGPKMVTHTTSIFPGPDGEIPGALVEPIQRLEKFLDEPIWLLVQNRHDGSPWAHLEDGIRLGFLKARRELRKCEKVGLILDTSGGDAAAAYQIASMLRRHCGGFDCIVPRYAKSAGTLLALGGARLYMGSDAELGPLDVQIMDHDREAWGSALDEIQALERLNAAALEQVDQAMFMLLVRTGKKIETLLPPAIKFATDMARPLLDKIDTVHYTQQSRLLKVAEDYAVRLLRPKYTPPQAEAIARQLVNNYPEHGFVIDRDEAETFLQIEDAPQNIQDAIDEIEEFLAFNHLNAIGRLAERVQDDS